MGENSVRSQIMAKIGSRPDVRLFRNNVGMAYQGRVVSKTPNVIVIENYRHITYGVQNPGGHDLIGWKSVVVTPDMVGKRLALFVAIESKAAKGKASEPQNDFKDAVIRFGGISGVANSLEAAKEIIDRPL